MFGPGEYVPDPTEGISDPNDLPQPIVVPHDRNHDHSPCPRCGPLAYRHQSGQRTLHDLGDLALVVRLISWSFIRLTTAHTVGSISTAICPI